jgi:DNA repair exonuclease SbcCD ATPase subunit
MVEVARKQKEKIAQQKEEIATLKQQLEQAGAAATLASAASMADSSQPLSEQQTQQPQQQAEALQQRVSELESELADARQLWSEQSDWQEAAERAGCNNAALKEQLAVLQQQLQQAEAQLSNMCGSDYIAELEQQLEEERESRSTAEQLLSDMQEKLLQMLPGLRGLVAGSPTGDRGAVSPGAEGPERDSSSSPEPTGDFAEMVLECVMERIAAITANQEAEVQAISELHRCDMSDCDWVE